MCFVRSVCDFTFDLSIQKKTTKTNHNIYLNLKNKKMKKLIFAILIAVAVTGSAFAKPAEIISEIVSNRVLNSFQSDFSTAQNVTWKVDKNFVKASFVLDNQKTEAFYTVDGDLLATSKAIAFNKLPESAIRTITTKYPFPPYVLDECIELVRADGSTNYYISLKNNNTENIVLEITESGNVSEFIK